MFSGPSFMLAFVFSINSLILSGFPMISLALVEALQSTFSGFCTTVCAVVQKYHEISVVMQMRLLGQF